MKLEGIRRSGGWPVVALVAVILLVPTAAFAAGTFVTIQEGGINANVTPAHQLQATETLPSTYREFKLSVTGGGAGCYTLAAIPSTSGLVLRQIHATITTASAEQDYFQVFDQPSCGGAQIATVDYFNLGEFGGVSPTQTFSFDPGFGLAPGTTLSVQLGPASTSQYVDIFANGYSVPSSEVPSSTP